MWSIKYELNIITNGEDLFYLKYIVDIFKKIDIVIYNYNNHRLKTQIYNDIYSVLRLDESYCVKIQICRR